MDPMIVNLWNRALGPRFPMDLRLWRQNTSDHPSFDPRGLLVESSGGRPVGLALVRLGSEGSWLEVLAVDPGFRRQGLGTSLVGAAMNLATGRWLRAGAGPAHFFPGVPEGLPEARRLLERLGFHPDWEAHDLLWRSAGGPPPPLPPTVGPCRGEEAPALLAFLEAEFPGRWLSDTKRRLEREPGPGDILVAREGGRVLGFCHAYHRGSRVLGPSVYWRGAMGRAWGGIGPVGVAASARGRGLGADLVSGALAWLQEKGCTAVGVDWTGLPDFYRRFGFEPWIRYRGMVRSL